MIPKKINKQNFDQGFDISQFHVELLESTFAEEIINCGFDAKNVTVTLKTPLNASQESELNTFVDNHVPIQKTAIEVKGKEMYSTNDYHRTREELRDLVTDFVSLNDNEKDIVARYCLYDDMTIIGYHQSKGMSMEDAISKHKVNRAIDLHKAASVCKSRTETAVIKYIIIKYLTEADGLAFSQATANYFKMYSETAHLGIDYRGPVEGILDYVNATNAHENGGLSQFSINTPYTYEQCRDELVNYLRYGIVPTIFSEFS